MKKKIIILSAVLFVSLACFPLPPQQKSYALDTEADINKIISSAQQGDAEAQYNLGVMYAQGLGVTQNYAEAVKWYRKAAEQGYAAAQFNLGGMYHQGQGVPQEAMPDGEWDYSEAMKWYRKAAEQGHANAQSNLGLMYAQGQGVTQDYAEAYFWFNLAVASGYEGARSGRDIIAKKLSQNALIDAQKRVREWKPKTPEETMAD